MSSISIKLQNIIELETDAIVNAANSNLVQGSGVCGAIFDGAGAYEMRKACSVYGSCKTGSAVITSGFRLPARYVIHAVGPIWTSGINGEPELLYSAYKSSLDLLKKYNLRSIGFPLISAGIYNYPTDKAWNVALKACRDFIRLNMEYDVEIVFAVLDENIKALGERIMSDLENNKGPEVIRFHNPDDENGYLSNWYKCRFSVFGTGYNCLEQYMMHQKALLFGDPETAMKIMTTTDPDTIRTLGRQVKNFDNVVWNGTRQIIVYNGLLAKYSQNQNLRKMLLATGDSILVECASSDTIWANGLNIQDPKCNNIKDWKGQNLLGFATMLVRDELRRFERD